MIKLLYALVIEQCMLAGVKNDGVNLARNRRESAGNLALALCPDDATMSDLTLFVKLQHLSVARERVVWNKVHEALEESRARAN